MTKPASDEEQLLRLRARQRLIGASVLLLTVAIVLPLVLDSEPKLQVKEMNIQSPIPDAQGFVGKRVPLMTSDSAASSTGAATVTSSGSSASTPPSPSSASTVPAPLKASAKEAGDANKAGVEAKKANEKAAAEKAENARAVEMANQNGTEKQDDDKTRLATPSDSAPTVKPSPPAKPPQQKLAKSDKPTSKSSDSESKSNAKVAPVVSKVAEKPGTYFIQVTALLDADKAKQVQQKVWAAGIPAFSHTVTAVNGKVTRVRAGPFLTKSDAGKAQAKLQELGFSAKVSINP